MLQKLKHGWQNINYKVEILAGLTVAMTMIPESLSFAILANLNPLNGLYAAFGKLIDGMDIVHKIENVEVQTREEPESGSELVKDKPINPPVITSIRVETFGVNYGEPIIHEKFNLDKWFMDYYGLTAE